MLDGVAKLVSPATVRFFPGYCVRKRHRKCGCEECVRICPGDCVKLEGDVSWEPSRCTHCGACVAACPVGAFQLSGVPEEEHYAAAAGNGLIVLGCERARGAWFSIPCVAGYDWTFMVALMIHGAGELLVLGGGCDDCSNRRAVPAFERSLALAKDMARVLGLRCTVRVCLDGAFPGEVPAMKGEIWSRRGFFRFLRLKTVRAASLLLASREDAPVPDRGLARGVPPGRKRILAALEAVKDPVCLDGTLDGLPFGHVQVRDDCDGCGLCALVCPTGALGHVDDEEHVQLTFVAGRCTNCRTCFTACPRSTLEVALPQTLSQALELSPVVVQEFKKSRCETCGQKFIGTGGEVCPECRRHREIQRSLMSMIS